MKKYLIGYVASIVLTLSAYGLVKWHLDSGHKTPSDESLVLLLIMLAVVQILVQLIFFLHLGSKKMRWNYYIFIATSFVIFILVAGTIWIMNSLNNNMHDKHDLTPAEIIKDEGFDSHD